MRKAIIQTSCSELLVDTRIYDAKVAYERFSELFKEVGWESSPPLTQQLLEDLIKNEDERQKDDDIEQLDIVVYDKNGSRAWVEYGENGYIVTGFRFDSHSGHEDTLCYSIFREAIRRLNGQIISCDGGSTEGYEEWINETNRGES